MCDSLLNVLRCLGSAATDLLVGCLKDERALSAARLACHALRAFVDSSTTSLTIKVSAADRQRWVAGQPPPPLARRWPRCTHVTLENPEPRNTAADDVALLALLPFASEPGAGRHVESLKLDCFTYDSGTYGEALVCRLVPLLPNLRNLDFNMHGGMSFDPLQQQLMYATLATLPRLEQLTLPECRSLDRLAALASLRRLKIQGTSYEGDILSPAARAGLMQLQQLEVLELPYCHLGADGSDGGARSGVHALLYDGLPPSLRQLCVGLDFINEGEYNGFVRGASLSIEFHPGGSFSSVDIEGDEALHSPDLAASAQLLLCSLAMPPTLDHLSITYAMKFDNNWQPAGQEQMHTLMKRCIKVQAHVRVDVSPTTPAAAVVELLRHPGPNEVGIYFKYNDMDLRTDFRVYFSLGGAPGISRDRQYSPPPGPDDLLRAALQRMAAGGGASSSHDDILRDRRTGMLLLQGPVVAKLLATSELETTEWVRRLGATADAAAPGNGWGYGGTSGTSVQWFQAVPLVNGVLVLCSSEAAAAGVGTAAAGAAAAAVCLQSVESCVDSPKEALFEALKPVMAAFWEGSAHGGEHFTERERLQCMLALRDAFNALPKEKYL